MVTLLIFDPRLQANTAQHHFGGLPVVPKRSVFNWPKCRTCDGAMQFLGQIRIPELESRVLLFMCQNNPGLCDEFDAEAGGNCAMIVSNDDLRDAELAQEGETRRPAEYAAREVNAAEENYDAARDAWGASNNGKRRDVLGQIRGVPSWVQVDETPICNACGKPMRFLAQLEEGPDWETAMNFGGGGCAYVFDCRCGSAFAKFLLQR